MTYEQKLLKRIQAAQSAGNYALAAKLISEHSRLLEHDDQQVRYTLNERAATPEEREKLTEHAVTLLVMCDILYKHSLEFADILSRRYDLHDLDLIQGINQAVDTLRRLVTTVDVDSKLSNHFADLCEEIELRGELPLLNTVRTVIRRRLNFL